MTRITPAALLDETPLRAELLAAVRPHAPTGETWTHVGGYLGRSVVLQCGEVVLKCFLHAAESKWQRELRAYSFLEDSQMPVPRLIASGHLRESVPWLLMSRVPGQVGVDVLDRMTAAERLQVFGAAGSLLARMHALPVDERLTHMPLIEASEAYQRGLASRIHDYSRRAAQGTHRRASSLVVARSWALELLPYRPSALAFTHGDFSPRNLLVEQSGPGWALTGLIDFERCEYGDAAVDLARMLIACPDWGDAALLAFFDAYTTLAQAPSRERILLQLGLIALDAALWAQDQDPAYYDLLLDLVDRVHDDPEVLPACFPRIGPVPADETA